MAGVHEVGAEPRQQAVLAVEEEDEVAVHGPRVGLDADLSRRRLRAQELAVAVELDAGELHGLAVFPHDEVVLVEPDDDLALLVGHQDVDQHLVDLHLFAELGLRLLGRNGSGEHGKQRYRERCHDDFPSAHGLVS